MSRSKIGKPHQFEQRDSYMIIYSWVHPFLCLNTGRYSALVVTDSRKKTWAEYTGKLVKKTQSNEFFFIFIQFDESSGDTKDGGREQMILLLSLSLSSSGCQISIILMVVYFRFVLFVELCLAWWSCLCFESFWIGCGFYVHLSHSMVCSSTSHQVHSNLFKWIVLPLRFFISPARVSFSIQNISWDIQNAFNGPFRVRDQFRRLFLVLSSSC